MSESKEQEKTPEYNPDDTTLSIDVGDIVEINSPTNSMFHEKTFFIYYLDDTLITLLNIETLEKHSITIQRNKFVDESIISVNILDKPEKRGFAINNNLIPTQWVDVYFKGDVPEIYTGEITNLEEDMVEIKLYPSNDIIYIDFAYKGIPEDLEIDKFVIRDKPVRLVENEKQLSVVQEQEEQTTKSPIPGDERDDVDDVPIDEQEDDVVVKEGVDISIKDKEEMIQEQLSKEKIDELLVEADDIEFGEELEAITQIVNVSESEKRYSIENQTNDLLDELLSTVPTTERTRKVLFDIHNTIERYNQLHKSLSTFDDYGNANGFVVKGSLHKPLISTLKTMDTHLHWIIPTVIHSNKLYDVETSDFESNNDILPLELAASRFQEEEIVKNYLSNSGPDSQNKYSFLMNELNEFLTPFSYSESDEGIITKKEAKGPITVAVNNSDDFETTVAVNNKDVGILDKKRFYITKYNKGLTRLNATQISGSHMVANHVKLTPNDLLHVRSLLFLPEPVINYSRISLPATSILRKSNLHQSLLQLHQLLNNNTTINTTTIEDIEREYEYDEETFLKEFHEIKLDESITHPDRYQKFLETIVPRTRILFTLIKKYVKGTISFKAVIEFLEPFMIYQDDITYKQYQTIIHFLRKKIKSFRKKFVKNDKEYSRLSNYKYRKGVTKHILLDTFKDKEKVYSLIPSLYQIDETNDTDSEMLNKMRNVDLGQLYMEALSFLDVDLQSSLNIQAEIDRNVALIQAKEDKRKSKCKNYTLAKKYKDIDELLDDNEKTIYFDRKYDETRYEIMEEYSAQRETMSTEQLTDFIQQELMQNVGLNETNALYEATNMILGQKVVLEGHYAVLEVNDPRSEIPNGKKFHYYKRQKNKWARDAKIPSATYEDNELFFCNVQDKCFSIDKKCDSFVKNKLELKKNLLEDLIDNFEDSYNDSQERILQKIKESLELRLSNIEIIKEINIREKYKFNTKYYQMGIMNQDKEVIVSPYTHLRDLILSQPDFTKRQNDILQFSARYTREADDIVGENIYWAYCRESNVPLLPTFFVTLANAFIEHNNYTTKLDEICGQIGVLSDDGDSWVDKHSGYTIKAIEFSTDEGYDESGFKLRTREKLEKDLGTVTVMQNEKPDKFESPESEMVHNIVHTMLGYIGVSINTLDFIVKNVTTDMVEQVDSEEKYQKRVEEAAKKGKKLISYETVKNNTLLILTLSYLFIALQTSIPSIKTRKTFPGCVRSFSGFPLEGEGDESGLMYITCIAHKIKSSIKPWNTIRKNKLDILFKKIKIFVTKIIEKLEVQDKLKQKMEYLLSSDDTDIPEEHSVSKWKTFMPPLIPVKVSALRNISADFKKNIVDYPDANLQLRSKMMAHSYAIIESIQDIVTKEKPILTNMLGEPFLENACCNLSEYTSADFFIEKDKRIDDYNEIIDGMDEIYRLNRMFGKAPFLFHDENTKNQYPQFGTEYNEDAIYKMFIKHCKYNSGLQLDKDLQLICTNNTSEFKQEDDIKEKIRILKAEGRNYTSDNLQQLLQVIGHRGIFPVTMGPKFVNRFQGLREFIEYYVELDEQSLDMKFLTLLNENLDTFQISVDAKDKNIDKLTDYVSLECDTMRDEIIQFISNNAGVSRKKFKPIREFITNITNWNLETDKKESFLLPQDETTYKMITFVKETIKSMILFFPNLVTNELEHKDIKIPKHWNLSQNHVRDVYSVLTKEYEMITEFYGNDVLKPMLNLISNKYQILVTLMDLTPVYSYITTQKSKVKPIFNNEVSNLLFEYYFLFALKSIISVLDEHVIIMKSVVRKERDIENDDDIVTDKIIENELRGEISEIDVIQGESHQKNQILASYLYKTLVISEKRKKDIDYNFEQIMEKINRSKEKEKDNVTMYMRNLDEDSLRVEDTFKNLKLEKWSKGLQKGLTQYVQKTYDEERGELEKQTLNEMKMGKMDVVSEMNQDIYNFELDEHDRVDAEIDREVNDLSGLAEDDDFGNKDGDEEY
tara:strand:+ start:1341 stop:7310 length:5970 start_codon:yes stop_codon:yes gene_type:complete